MMRVLDNTGKFKNKKAPQCGPHHYEFPLARPRLLAQGPDACSPNHSNYAVYADTSQQIGSPALQAEEGGGGGTADVGIFLCNRDFIFDDLISPI